MALNQLDLSGDNMIMRTLAAALFIVLAASACTSAQSSEPESSPVTSLDPASPDIEVATTNTPVVFEAVLGDPLIALLEQSRHLIFDYGLRFPDDFLDKRSECVSTAFLEVLGPDLFAQLGLEGPVATVQFVDLSDGMATEASLALAECEATLPIIRALLDAQLHPVIGGCVETKIVNASLEPDLIHQLGRQLDVVSTVLVADLAATCRAERIDGFGPSIGGQDRQIIGDLLWTISGVSAPNSEFETMCRSRVMTSELDEAWTDRLVQFSDGNITISSISVFLRDSTTEQEAFDLEYLVSGALLPLCGSPATWLDHFYELNLSPDELRCLSAGANSQLTGYLNSAPAQREVQQTVSALLDRCGAA